MMDHVASTIYSALGIDYGKKIADTPSGRAFEYQQTAPLGGPGVYSSHGYRGVVRVVKVTSKTKRRFV